MSRCLHKEVVARPIIGDVGAGNVGSQAFCVKCHDTVLHPGSPDEALRYFRRHIGKARARKEAGK